MDAGRADAVEKVAPLLRRLLAPNPSPFTFTGTYTHIVGRGEVAVIDPGPDLPDHIDALLAALAGEKVAAILVTHNHRDHSPAARALGRATGAPVIGCAPLCPPQEGAMDAAFDPDYRPDGVLGDGETVEAEGWTLEAVATPGHTSNHLCFAWRQADALFSGDHVMAWSTSIVSPPDGDMAAYRASLAKLLERGETVYYPAHGPVIADGKERVRALVAHRKEREEQVLAALMAGESDPGAMAARIYAGLDPLMLPAARQSVLAHLIELEGRELVQRTGSGWKLASLS